MDIKTTEDILSPDNLSVEKIKSILDAAFMDASYSDGDEDEIIVTEQIPCLITINQKKDLIRLSVRYCFSVGISELQQLSCVNKINTDYLIIRASIQEVGNNEANRLRLDWYISISGGVTKKSLILAIKRFCSIPHVAIKEYASEFVD